MTDTPTATDTWGTAAGAAALTASAQYLRAHGYGPVVRLPAPSLMPATVRLSAEVAEALARMQETLGERLLPSIRSLTQQLARLMDNQYVRANAPVHVAGLCARYQVRAGQDPLYTSHGNIDLLVQAILDGDDPEAEGLELLTMPNRVLVAVAAMRGWSESHGWAVPQGVLHRQWGDTQVQVRCG